MKAREFSEEMDTFTVLWLNWDGNILEWDSNVPYGTTPTYDGETPSRDEGDGMVYIFAGWEPEVVPVTENAVYNAVFTSETKTYKVKVTSSEGGTAYAVPDEGPTGREVYLFAVPDEGYQFTEWVVKSGGVTVSDDRFTIGAADVEIEAVFEIKEEPVDINVVFHFIKGDGSRGVPEDIQKMMLTPRIILRGEGLTARSEGMEVEIEAGTVKVETTAQFAKTLPELSPLYEVTVEGLPEQIDGIAPANSRYKVNVNAWVNKDSGITVIVILNDGKYYGPEEPYFYPLPEDEIGAYRMDPWGNKEYLLYHTYDICMFYLGSDELCSGYERCFHKELPFIYDGNKIRYGK